VIEDGIVHRGYALTGEALHYSLEDKVKSKGDLRLAKVV